MAFAECVRVPKGLAYHPTLANFLSNKPGL